MFRKKISNSSLLDRRPTKDFIGAENLSKYSSMDREFPTNMESSGDLQKVSGPNGRCGQNNSTSNTVKKKVFL